MTKTRSSREAAGSRVSQNTRDTNIGKQPPRPVVRAQKSHLLGNQATLRTLQSGSGPVSSENMAAAQSVLGNQAVLRRLQAQGIVDTPGDRHEQEADHAAHQVMQTSGGCTCDGGCSKCGGKGEIKRADSGQLAKVPHMVQEALRAPGQALDLGTRSFMEARFGRDFSGVRIHTDAASAQSAKAMHASAYTVGSDIVFASGQFSPNVSRSRALLAHELAHVAQPSAGKPAIQRSPDSEAEREAARKEAIEALAAMDRQEALDDAKEKEEEEKAARKNRPRPIGLSTLDPNTLCGGRPCMTDENLAAIEKKSRKELDVALKEVDDRENESRKTPYKTRLHEARNRCWAARGDYGVLSKLTADEVWNAGDFLPIEKTAVYKDQGEIRRKDEEARKQVRRQFEVQKEMKWEAQGDAVLSQSQALFFQPFLGGGLGLVGTAYEGAQMGMMVGQTYNACKEGAAECAQAALPLAIGLAAHRAMRGGRISEGPEAPTSPPAGGMEIHQGGSQGNQIPAGKLRVVGEDNTLGPEYKPPGAVERPPGTAANDNVLPDANRAVAGDPRRPRNTTPSDIRQVYREKTGGTGDLSPADPDVLSSPDPDQVGELSDPNGPQLSTREVWEPPAGAAPRPRLSAPRQVRLRWLRERLQLHVDAAIERYRLEGLTTRQEAALRDRAQFERAFRGSRIDQFAKDSILQDPELAEVIIAPDFFGEPDVLDSVVPDWFDMTTRQQWAAHVQRYAARYGQGHLLPAD